MNVGEALVNNRKTRPRRESAIFKWDALRGYVTDGEFYCPCCNAKIEVLRDQLSIREFVISGMCQACQDSVFGM